MENKNNKTMSRALVVIQVILLGLLAFFGDLPPSDYFFYLTIVSGVLLLIWSFVSKKMSVNIFPEPTKQMPLITSGPYKYIRHPIYTSVLLITISLIPFGGYLYLFVISWLALLSVLLIKIRLEEKLLIEQFPEYKAYSEKSDKLLPFIY